jgi:hypothetical protein
VFIGAKSFRRGQTAIGLGHRVVNRRMYPPGHGCHSSDPLPTFSRRIHQMHTAARGALDGFIGLGIVRGVIPPSSLGPFASSSGGGREKRPSLHIHEGPVQDLTALEKLGLRYQSIGAPSAQIACSQSGAAVRLGQRG